MADFSACNTITQKSPKRVWRSPWRIRAQDNRPRCVLVVGDGFSRGFLHSQNISHLVQSGIDQHFDLPDTVLYQPLPNEYFGPTQSPMWDERKWPLTIAGWRKSGAKSGREFYASVALEWFNKDRREGVWTFETKSLYYELRCYLWHLFHSYDLLLDQHFSTHAVNCDAWPWTPTLLHLLKRFKLSALSFNYDEILEDELNSLGRHFLKTPFWPEYFVEEPEFPIEDFPILFIPIFKPHGGISHYLRPELGTHYEPRSIEQCPWMLDLTVARNSIRGVRTRFQLNRKAFPWIPDIVPPGRPGDDICNPSSRVVEMGHEAIGRAEVVIFCGLSAAEPDTTEVRALVSHIRRDAVVFQVGLKNCDEQNPLALLLKGAPCQSVRFVDATEVQRIVAYLKDWEAEHRPSHT